MNKITDVDRPHAVVRFRRDCTFPRFTVKAGETFSFVVYGKWATALENIRAGRRFDYAGGQCLAEDVEIIYEGPCNRDYSIAAGDIPADRLFIGVYPAGLSYADRWKMDHGDYVRLAFLQFSSLELTIYDGCPEELRGQIRTHAAGMQVRRGETFKVSTSGQTVLLGSQRGHA